MKIRPLLLAIAAVFLLATSSNRAAQSYCAALDAQVNSWQAYLEGYGVPTLLSPAGILAYGDTVTNSNDRVLNARHKTDVSTIFVENLEKDFIRVATSVPDGVEGSHETAVGTTLTRNGSAYNALAAGTEYCGTVTLFGTSYDSVYRPIFQNGVVIGALFVGNVSK
jgi:hypothetical protein